MKTEDNINELIEMLFKISRLLKGEMSYRNNLTHLSILQVQTLVFLNQNKNNRISMSDIAEYFRIELPSASSLINKLCIQKLIKRYEDQQDRRIVLITLTHEGEKLLEQAVRERRKKLEKILSYLSIKEKFELLAISKTLHNRLQK